MTLAAEQGLPKAQFNLGAMYASGTGVEQSFTATQEWFAKAAAQKHEKAIAALQQLDEIERSTTATSTDNKKETSNTSTQQEEDEQDECPICLEVLPKLSLKFLRMMCCGKGMHFACQKKKNKSTIIIFICSCFPFYLQIDLFDFIKIIFHSRITINFKPYHFRWWQESWFTM